MAMLWLGLIATVGLLASLSLGQAYPPTTARPYPGPGPSYPTPAGRPNKGSSQNSDGNAEKELETLNKNVETLEDRNSAQQTRGSMLDDTTNQNTRFKIDFQEIFNKEITDKQYQQDSQLDALAKKIAEIQKLRAEATEAWNKLSSLKTAADNAEAADSKVLHTIQDLQGSDDADKEEIEDILARVDSLEESLSPMLHTITNDYQSILQVELLLKNVILQLNAKKARVSEYHLTLDDGAAHVTEPYPGIPSQDWIGVTGNEFKINKTYQEGDLAIHYIATANYYNDKVYLDVLDSSTTNLGTSVARVDLVTVAML